MVSYQAMNIPSTSQFAPTRMGLYEPFHQMSLWEETLRGDMIPSTGGCMVTQANERTDDNKVFFFTLKLLKSSYRDSHQSDSSFFA